MKTISFKVFCFTLLRWRRQNERGHITRMYFIFHEVNNKKKKNVNQVLQKLK